MKDKDAIEDKKSLKVKVRIGELANEAIEIIKRMKELEIESEKLMERKSAGEAVKDLIKQNKVELKRLKEREMVIYLESKNMLRTERKREESNIFNEGGGVVYPGPVPPFNPVVHQEKKRTILNNIYEFVTEEDQRVLYVRHLDLADKLRLGRIKICIVLILMLFLPIILVFIIVQSYL